MAHIEINGPNDIGNIGEPHKSTESTNAFEKIFADTQERISSKIPNNDTKPPSYTTEKEFITDVTEIWEIVSTVAEEIVSTVIPNSGLSPPI
mgnify:CR=1 FL=1